MNLVDQSLRFLRLADRDIQAFHVLKLSPAIHISTVCFHAQQAVEKSLKAVLICKNKDPNRTHDLNQLAYSIIEEKISLPLSVEELSKLNPYAVVFRYDDTDIELLTRDEAQRILEIVYNWAYDFIKNNGHIHQ